MKENISDSNGWLSLIPFALLFIITFIFFAFLGDYVLFFQEKSSLFLLTKGFLTETISQPGGFIVWIGKLASSFFILPSVGALVMAAVIALIAFTSSGIIKGVSGCRGTFFPVFIAVLLFYLQTEYRFIFFNIAGLLLQLLLFLVTVRHIAKLKGWAPLLVLPLWYFLTGGFAIIYSIMLTLLLGLNGIKSNVFKIPAIWLVNILTFYVSKEFIFFQTTQTLLSYPWSDISTGYQSKLFFFVVTLLALLPVISKINFNFPRKLKIRQHLGTILITAFTVILFSAVAVSRYDSKNASYFHVEKLFCEGKFDDVIKWNLEHQSNNKLTIFLNNIALSETNRLNDMLFNFPQSPDGSTLFLKWEMTGEILRRGAYFYYATGMINEAHRWAFENMVMRGLTPEGLKMLIKTELINGNYKMASRYINMLKQTFFYRKEALALEKFLFNDKAVNADPDLGAKRKIKLKTDFFTITDDPNVNIERIYSSDSLNRQAFDYKTAFSMLRKDYPSIANELPRFGRYGYKKFPLHVAEAAVALSVFNNGKLPDLGSIQMTGNTSARWEQFLTVFQKYGTNPQTAEPALRKQFGNTFWYYSFYK